MANNIFSYVEVVVETIVLVAAEELVLEVLVVVLVEEIKY